MTEADFKPGNRHSTDKDCYGSRLDVPDGFTRKAVAHRNLRRVRLNNDTQNAHSLLFLDGRGDNAGETEKNSSAPGGEPIPGRVDSECARQVLIPQDRLELRVPCCRNGENTAAIGPRYADSMEEPPPAAAGRK